MIARAYTEFSYSSQVAAFQRASLFQEEVAAIYLSMEDLSIDEGENVDIASTDTSGSAIIDSPVGSTYCDSNEFPSTSEAEKEKAEQGEIFYECNSSSISDNFEANPKPAADTSSSADENINREGLENEEGATGPLTIRDRFAYLLPRSASNSKRSAMGDFVVVHV